MACVHCPYQQNYELLWTRDSPSELICVMLRCCAGPELQVRRGREVLRSEFYRTHAEVRARAEQLRREHF